MKYLIYILLFLIATLFAFVFLVKINHSFTSPISSPSYSPPQTTNSITPIKYAFLPYWSVSDTTDQDLNQLTHLAYFGIEPNSNGSIKKLNQPNQSEPGWHTLNKPQTLELLQNAQQIGVQTQIVIKMFNQDEMTQLLSSPESTTALVENIIQLISTYNFHGVNIDFEPNSGTNEDIASKFTEFIKLLNQEMNSIDSELELSIDVYPSAATTSQLWSINQLNPHIDYFIIMAYDYYRPSSTHSGPIAPLYNSLSSKNIMNHLKEFSSIVPSNKLVLGIPIYGYQWQTTDQQPLSPTFPGSSFTLSLKSILEKISSGKYQVNWNQNTFSHWLAFSEDDKYFQIHYESPQSIQLKLKLIQSAGLKGVAIWALGYQPNNFTLQFE